MPQTARTDDAENPRIILGLLESVERDGAQSQRKLATDLDIALGLVNAYLRRCVAKGLLKMSQVPTRRYAYYLTPHGFAEKSRLTVEYLTSSFSFFRRAREDCTAVLAGAKARGYSNVVLLGCSDLVEVMVLCALEQRVTVEAVIDPAATVTACVGIPVRPTIDRVASTCAVVVTDLRAAQQTADTAVSQFGLAKVYAPFLLGVRLRAEAAASDVDGEP